MRTISPDALMAHGAAHTKANVAEAWAQAHRALRSELADPEVLEVLVLVGCPGAGKSTWLAGQPDADASVAFDAVHAGEKGGRRAAIARRITDAGKRPIAVLVYAPLEQCLARNADRAPWRRVPEAFIRRAWGELQRWPVHDAEGWAEIWRVAGTDVRLDRETSEDQDRKAGRVAYRWRTQNDGKVRPEHAKRHGRLFGWTYPPEGGHPGEDFGCRCWPELVPDDDVIETRSGDLRARPLTIPKWARQR